MVEAENAGVLEPGEKEMIAGVMRLGDLPVGAVMTPRREVSMINLADACKPSDRRWPPAAIPALWCSIRRADAALGIVKAKDMLDCYLSGQTPDIGKLVRPAPVIPEFLDARDVVAILRDSAVHMGLVHDEYGAFQGVVTSADILESIVGGFHTEEGPPEAAAVKRDDGSYLISGWMPAVEFAIAAPDRVAGVPSLSDRGRLPAQPFRPDTRCRRSRRGGRLALRGRRSRWPAHRQGAGRQDGRRFSRRRSVTSRWVRTRRAAVRRRRGPGRGRHCRRDW